MKDTFWTPELLAEFFNTHPDLPPTLMNEINLFKSSKAPKKEWEIVAFKLEDKIYKLTNDGQYRDVRPAYSDGVAYFGLDYAFEPKNNCTIHSVRRLSDQAVFTKSEVVGTPNDGQHHIGGFEVIGNFLYALFSGGQISIEHLQKLPQPILTTVDGVEIFESDDYYFVDANWNIRFTGDNYRWLSGGMKAFADEENAIIYVLENRPLLSLNDVKEFLRSHWIKCNAGDIEELTALVKQKLNQ